MADTLERERTEADGLIDRTSEIVVAFLNKNTVEMGDVISMIRRVHDTLARISDHATAAQPDQILNEADVAAPRARAAVSVEQSVKPDYIVCLEDGKRLRTLKRYLHTHYRLTPEQYRAKWGLPPDYPMVAPSYAKLRSSVAKQMGLGLRDTAGSKTRRSRRGKTR